MEIQKIIWNTTSGYVYNDDTFENDIVVLKLKSPLSLNSNVQPACLPSADWAPDTDSNNRCFVSGWGTMESGLYYSCIFCILIMSLLISTHI